MSSILWRLEIIFIFLARGIFLEFSGYVISISKLRRLFFLTGDPLENSRSKIAMGVKHFEDLKLLESSELDEKPCSSPDNKDGFVDSVDGIDDKNNESDIEDICSKNETVLYERKNSTSEAICKETRLKVIEENMKINFKIEANVNIPPNSAHISMWDFAGEDVFYATHHVFLSPDAVYLIVIDLSNADTNNITEIGKCGFSPNKKLCKSI